MWLLSAISAHVSTCRSGKMCGFHRPGKIVCMLWRFQSGLAQTRPQEGLSKCDRHQPCCDRSVGLAPAWELGKVGPVQWHWIQLLVPLSQFQSRVRLSKYTTRRSASGLRATTMSTASTSLLASTSVTAAATGGLWAFIASSCSGTQTGQGLSGVGTRNESRWPIVYRTSKGDGEKDKDK